MLAVIIPTLNSQKDLPDLVSSFGTPVDRIVVSDGGSSDQTLKIANRAGAVIASGSPGRGQQLRRGASWAPDHRWLLFLHADSHLPENWLEAVSHHMNNRPNKAAYFNLAYMSDKWQARLVERLVWLRSIVLGLPYGDQGLLISRDLYEDIGGYDDIPIFEDVDIARRLGRRRLKSLSTTLTTCARKYEADGFFKRGWSNLKLLRRYWGGENTETLLADYSS